MLQLPPSPQFQSPKDKSPEFNPVHLRKLRFGALGEAEAEIRRWLCGLDSGRGAMAPGPEFRVWGFERVLGGTAVGFYGFGSVL